MEHSTRPVPPVGEQMRGSRFVEVPWCSVPLREHFTIMGKDTWTHSALIRCLGIVEREPGNLQSITLQCTICQLPSDKSKTGRSKLQPRFIWRHGRIWWSCLSTSLFCLDNKHSHLKWFVPCCFQVVALKTTTKPILKFFWPGLDLKYETAAEGVSNA